MNPSLIRLGFSPFFSQQLDAAESEESSPVRVIEVQRSGLVVSDGMEDSSVPLSGSWYQKPPEERPTVGDWLLLDAKGEKILRLLDRKSVFKRLAAGTTVELQLIAANIDTLFVVMSCNQDFNESRLERYLALALEAGVDPVVILTKADLTDDGETYRQRAAGVKQGLPVELVNALDADSLQGATAWVSSGATVAVVGSSGVGKSTIVNTLSGAPLMQTGAVREGDAKGRHTTSYRALHLLDGGGILLDVPGMREIKIADAGASLAQVFDDVASLASDCRFQDCAHDSEPGCAVQRALQDGQIDQRRLDNYRKLLREEAHNRASISEKHKKERAFGRIVKDAIELKRSS